jgi:hypothetical protein
MCKMRGNEGERELRKGKNAKCEEMREKGSLEKRWSYLGSYPTEAIAMRSPMLMQ